MDARNIKGEREKKKECVSFQGGQHHTHPAHASEQPHPPVDPPLPPPPSLTTTLKEEEEAASIKELWCRPGKAWADF